VSAGGFDLTEESVGEGRTIVAVAGEIDLFTAPDLKAKISDAIAAGCRELVIDLTETTFLDSTALGVLIGALKRLREQEGVLVLVNERASIARTLEITGLDRIFTVVSDREAALAALEAEPAA
jgi:anti-sigma B factor antagonist